MVNGMDDAFTLNVNIFTFKIDQSIKQFKFNVSIALFYETYNYFRIHLNEKVSNKIFIDNLIKFVKLMIPFTPHLAFECLELHNCKEVNDWPSIQKSALKEIKIAVQINGKTRDVLMIEKDLNEKELWDIVINNSKTSKFLENSKIIKTIFVKNRIVNYITKK